MKKERFPDYVSEINRLKRVYGGKIQIYLGLEIDSISPWPTDGLDYVIRSVHDVFLDPQTVVCVDASRSKFLEGVSYLGGDSDKLVSLYYRTLTDMLKTQKQDIVGHFDLLTKFNAQNDLFDARSDFYRHTVSSALDVLEASGCILEVNTGAMSRGHTAEPYPAPWILRECHRRGVPVTLSSDTHSADTLDFAFDHVIQLLRDSGYRETVQLLDGNFVKRRL
jgi:histidinol-phosphatase (PHP family)